MNKTLEDHPYNVEIITCPSCNNEEAKIVTHILDIPYYTDYASITISCSICGYRSNDFLHLESKPPCILTYTIDHIDDHTTKVARSKDGIITIPELGINILPTNDTSTWIRNIEGILEDILEKLLISFRHAETNEEKQHVRERMAFAKRLKNAKESFTIIVEDPSGNSVILPYDETKLTITYFEDQEGFDLNSNEIN